MAGVMFAELSRQYPPLISRSLSWSAVTHSLSQTVWLAPSVMSAMPMNFWGLLSWALPLRKQLKKPRSPAAPSRALRMVSPIQPT